MVEKTLVPTKLYLQVGAHIGTKFKSEGMRRFIFKSRPDKLKVLDVNTIDERLRLAAKFLSRYEKEKIIVVSRKPYSSIAVKKFSELTGTKAYVGRFIPGTFTNTKAKSFVEPEVVFVVDPGIDSQAIKEAKSIKVPVVALCSTDNSTKDIDLIVPINNNGRQSIALAFYILAHEILKEKKEVKSESEFKAKLTDFEYKGKEVQEKQALVQKKTEKTSKKRFKREKI